MIPDNSICEKAAQNKLFRGLSKEEINSICRLLKTEHFKRNEYILKAGEKKRKVYCIVKGNVEVLNCFGSSDEIRLGILTDGLPTKHPLNRK